MSAVPLRAVEIPDDFPVEYDRKTLIAPGQYLARLIGHDTGLVFGRTPKVYLRFEIVEPGPAMGAKVFAAYRVASLIGKPGSGGRFKLRAQGDLFKMLCRVLQIRTRPDRVSVRELARAVLRIRVRTVTKDHKQHGLPEFMHYTVVDDVLGKETA